MQGQINTPKRVTFLSIKAAKSRLETTRGDRYYEVHSLNLTDPCPLPIQRYFYARTALIFQVE